MVKKELNEQLKSYEGCVNDIPLAIDPCKMCKYHSEEEGYEAVCATCCWFYDSKFEIGIDDNSCSTCLHKEKMLTNKKPCKDCDNGCNWEKQKGSD